MSSNTDINLIETFSIFKKNIKIFYVLMTIRFFISILGVASNSYINKPKISINTKIFVINPFDNFPLIDLLILDNHMMGSESASLMGLIDKIKGYEQITQEYKKFVKYQKEGLKKSILNQDNYEGYINNLDGGVFNLEMRNVIDLKSAQKDVEKFVNAINKIVVPVIINNFNVENEYLKQLLLSENYMGVTSNNFMYKKPSKMNTKLNMLYDTRVKAFEKLKIEDIRIFGSTSTLEKNKLNSTKIFLSIMLSFFCFFMLLVIVRK